MLDRIQESKRANRAAPKKQQSLSRRFSNQVFNARQQRSRNLRTFLRMKFNFIKHDKDQDLLT